MALADFLRVWGFTNDRTRETTAKAKYGVVSRTHGSITVYAPSGEEALRIAGTDGRTPEGNAYTVCNHKGGGVFEIKDEGWEPWEPW